MDGTTMVVVIVSIIAVARVLRARYEALKVGNANGLSVPNPDTARLREDLKTLKDRVAVLERIATDNNRGVALDREIEALRSRD